LNIFFDGGNFMKTVTDVYIHERLGLADEVRATKCYFQDDLSAIVHPLKIKQAENWISDEIKFLQFWEMVAEKISRIEQSYAFAGAE